MPNKPPLVKLSRIAFYTAGETPLWDSLGAALGDLGGETKLARQQLALATWRKLVLDVANGGFTQFFYNNRGEAGVSEVVEFLKSLGVPKPAVVLENAVTVYRAHQARFNVSNPFDGLFGSIKELEDLSAKFMNAGTGKASEEIEAWIIQHIQELAVGDDGRSLDPGFTGVVERLHPNGKVAERLAVKKGKADGRYEEFFDDGTPGAAMFYKAGKITGDFWPTGQVKKRESRKDDARIFEFFYPSGKLHKRLVKDKSGKHLEPVRLFYENGQLAEEWTVIKGMPGDWFKFFEDGSPKLQGKRTGPIDYWILNAWESPGKQVVKDGAGTYDDDVASIDSEFNVVGTSTWRRITELKDGVQHGALKTYHQGVFWGTDEYVRGKRHGKRTLYYDNGRLRAVIKFVDGKEVEEEEFPKYEEPVPVVTITIQADQKLYEAWRHIPVDQYPACLNLDEVRAQVQIPAFLNAIFERNKAGTLKSDYEDWSTFNAGVTHFVLVDENGKVVGARTSGADVHCGEVFHAYEPLLMGLRFTPGSIRGRPVACKVLVKVDHTFMEGKNGPKQK